jgi:hypothetical protein
MFMAGQVPDAPAERVERHDADQCIFGRQTFQAADKFTAGKTQLIDQHNRHGKSPPAMNSG